jgi:hypothetical protein
VVDEADTGEPMQLSPWLHRAHSDAVYIPVLATDIDDIVQHEAYDRCRHCLHGTHCGSIVTGVSDRGFYAVVVKDEDLRCKASIRSVNVWRLTSCLQCMHMYFEHEIQ